MAHVIIAKLTDAQFAQLQQTGIPFREFPPAFLDRIQALVPSMPLEEIFENLVKQGLGNAEAQKIGDEELGAAELRKRQRIQALSDELGLNT